MEGRTRLHTCVHLSLVMKGRLNRLGNKLVEGMDELPPISPSGGLTELAHFLTAIFDRLRTQNA